MPARNIIKPYVEQGYYHVYNRGVNKANIFFDEQNYKTFLSYLKTYLLPKDERELSAVIANPHTAYRERNQALRLLRMNNFFGKIELLAYCLMPNHFHFLIKQKDKNDMTSW